MHVFPVTLHATFTPSQVTTMHTIFLLLTLSWIMLFGEMTHAGYPTLVNLDISQVEFVLYSGEVGDEIHNRLHTRAVKKLAEAGLYHAPRSSSSSELRPTLQLFMLVYNLGDKGERSLLGKTCPGKWLYMQKFELWEYVYVKRNPDYRIWTVTWGRAVPLPMILEKFPMERLESDVDRYLDDFIADYKQANKQKTTE